MGIKMFEDIKSDEDLNIYGWDMRIMQVEDDIALLEKERDWMIKTKDSIKSSHTVHNANKEEENEQ